MSNTQQFAEVCYTKFTKAEGNQHIASLYALKKIIDLVHFNTPEKILEVGLGIGSISYTILEFLKDHKSNYSYHGTEANDFCLGQLPLNLGGHYDKLKIFPELNDLGNTSKYDFIIIDGSDGSLEKIRNLITENGVIFIEGDRKIQQDKLLKLFPKNVFVQTISNYKNPKHGPENWSTQFWAGGGKLIYINPTFRQKCSYIVEKIRTYIRYKKRKFTA